MNIITVEIDLAKNVFAVHDGNDNGKPELVKPTVSRAGRASIVHELPIITTVTWLALCAATPATSTHQTSIMWRHSATAATARDGSTRDANVHAEHRPHASI